LAFTIFFYAVVYTMWLKRRTPQNIVIGGAAGAFPPMIGWVVMTGSVDLPSVALFMLIFAWTPPHFWALALVKCDDYARARVPMLPVVAGRAATRLQILVYSVLLMPVGLAPWWLGFASSVYGAIALAANLVFLLLAIRVWHITEETAGEAAARKAAMRLFLFSILYLFGLFATLLAEPVAQHLWRLA
jgi:protoheme IX farnesyltransferase